jgi:hypothetical protein
VLCTSNGADFDNTSVLFIIALAINLAIWLIQACQCCACLVGGAAGMAGSIGVAVVKGINDRRGRSDSDLEDGLNEKDQYQYNNGQQYTEKS